MSKKGLSLEEKKARMLQLFYEKKEFYQLKELEKLAPKEKGITANSVKDVVQALVDDGSVDTDKIGGSIYFWAFPR